MTLQLKAMGFTDSTAIFAKCIDAPPAQSAIAAERQLRSMGAVDESGSLTPLGKHLAALPCPPRVGKMCVYGCLLGCLSPVLSVAAGLAIRSVFLTSQDHERRQQIDEAKRALASKGVSSKMFRCALLPSKFVLCIPMCCVDVSVTVGQGWAVRSDHVLLAKAFEEFDSSSDKRITCSRICVSYERMVELRTNRNQLAEALVLAGFLLSKHEVPCITITWPIHLR
jgi:HrpA-like RNA helicase